MILLGLNASIWILGLTSIGIITMGVLLYLNRKSNPYYKISFKETMDLCELPIVTFTNNGRKLNFLLDTGASKSVINSKDLDGLIYDKSNKLGDIYGMDGIRKDVQFINMSIEYKNKFYNEEFQAIDMSVPFSNLKSDFGVNLHGILSSAFFQKYKYVLNFEELIAYSKA